jgi:hypothetical protein
VEEEAEEERGAAYGWVSGRTPKVWGRMSRLMLGRRVTRREVDNKEWRKDGRALLSRPEVLTVR